MMVMTSVSHACGSILLSLENMGQVLSFAFLGLSFRPLRIEFAGAFYHVTSENRGHIWSASYCKILVLE